MNLFWLSCLLVSAVLVNGNIRSNERIIQTPRYLLTLPQILSPTSNQICLTSLNGFIPEEKELRITLIHPKTNDEIDTFNYKLDSDSQCFNIETENIVTKFVKVKVQLDTQLDVDQMIKFMPSFGMTMIETSKPLYQPGEVLNFRAIGFDGWVKPWDESFTSVSVYNAEGTKVMEWQGAQLEGGLKHYELPLAQYNKEGTWRIVGITKAGEPIEKLFQVNRNVSPNVVLKVKQGGDYVLANEELHRMVVCVEDKQGVLLEEGVVSFKTNDRHYAVKDLPLEEGCVNFYIKNETFQWSNKVGQALQGAVEYRSRETRYLYGSLPVHLPIVRSHVHLRVPSVAMVKNYFKAGLPYFGYLLVEKPDYTPLPNAEVEICYQTTSKPWQFEETEEKICKTFISTAEGSIRFIVPPVERSTKQIMIEATIPGVADHRQNFIVHPWAEESQDQFIIEPIVRVRSCKRSMPEATKYTLLMTRNGTQPFERLYLQPAGRVSAAQTKTVKLTPAPYTPEADLLIGEWPVNAEVFFSNVWEDVSSSNKYTPMNRVVFYGLDSQGNLISDSVAYLKDCLKDETLMEVTIDETNRLNVDLKAHEKIPCSVSVSTSAERGRLTEQKINKLLEKFDEIYTNTFEWDKCSLALQSRASKQPLMIDFKNNWDTFKEIGLHAVDSSKDIFNKPCEWDVFDEQIRNRSLEALIAIRHYLPYPETVMHSLADSADMAHLNRLENSLINDLLFWGSRSELNQWLEKFNPSTLNGKSSVAVNAICMDPIKGLRSHTVLKSLKTAPVYLEHDLPKKISDKAVRDVSIFIKRHESSIKESECVPVELEVDSDRAFEIRSELPKLCACSKATKVTLKVKPLKAGLLNLKVKAKYARSMHEECNSMINDFETQQTVLKTNIESFEPKVTRRSYEIVCKDTKKTLKLFNNEEKTHATSDLVNIFMKQFRDDEPIRKNIYEVLSKFNALMNMYEQHHRVIPSALATKLREALITMYQELALFRLSDGSYSVYGGSQRVPSLVATTFAYRAISQAQSKFPILGGADIINPTFDVIIGHMMKDGCFRPKHYANAAFSMWPFNHNVTELELTAFVASTMAEAKQTPRVILRRAAKCIDQLKQTEEMDSLTKAMSALLYARLDRNEDALTLVRDFDSTASNEILRRLNKEESRSIPERFLKSGSNDKDDEEIVRARAFLVLAKLALNRTDNLEEQVQQLVSSELSLHDPIISFAVTRAWPKISVQQRTLAISLNNERINLEQFEMKKIDMPKKVSNVMFEILAPGCALLERVEEIDVSKYNGTFPVKGEETREAKWLNPEGETFPYTRRGFKIIKAQRTESDSCSTRKITICPRQEDSNQRSINYKIALPANYKIDEITLDHLIAYQRTPIELYRAVERFVFISVGRYYESCLDLPMIQVGEMIDDEEPIAAIYAFDGADFNSQPLVGTVPIEKECSIRSRREVANNQEKRENQLERSEQYQQTEMNYPPQSYENPPPKGYSAPAYAPPAYEAPSYQAPAYEPAAKGYPAPPSYPAPSYEAPAYQAPAYEPPAYQAPAYEPPAKGYPSPPAYAPTYPAPSYEAPAYQAPAYEPPAYQAPAYEPPVKGYPSPPAYAPPAYTPPAYEAPAYQAPAYEPPAYQAPAYEPPAKGYPAPPAYAPPAYTPPAYSPPAYSPPAYSPPAYSPPAYSPPAYSPPAYEAPAYQAPAYEPPAYQAPAYEAPVKGYAPPPPPTYAPPAYSPPAYAPPAYSPPAYSPPAYEAPAYQAPAYEPPAYQAPAYEAPVKGYAPPPPPTYAPPAYSPPAYSPPAYSPPAYSPPAYAPPAYAPPSYEAPAYQAPTYEAPAKGYSPPAYAPPAYEAPAKGYPAPPAYAPPPVYTPPTYDAPAYRNAQGRTTGNRYENNFASNNGQQARNPSPIPSPKPTGYPGSRFVLAPNANRQAQNAKRSGNNARAPQLARYAGQASEEHKLIMKPNECRVSAGAGTCPDCRSRIGVDMVDRMCNSTIQLIQMNSGDNNTFKCGNFSTTSIISKDSNQIKNEFYAIDEQCECPELENAGFVLVISEKLKTPSADQTTLFGEETFFVRPDRVNIAEAKAYVAMCGA